MDDEVEGMRRDAQVDRESAGTRHDISIERERGSASALERSMTTGEENDQRPSSDDNNIPGMPPTPPEPPDGPVRPENQPPSAELEGEWDIPASCNVGLTSSDPNALGVSNGDEDPRNRPKGA